MHRPDAVFHRPASLALADRVLRMEAGRIVELTAPQDAAQSPALAETSTPAA